MPSDDLIDAYLVGIESLRQAFDGLSSVQLQARPIPGQWSSLEVLCHLADSEALFAERIKRVLAEDRPSLPFADPALFSAALAYEQRDAKEELNCIAATRQQMARILRAQSPEAWQRVGLHSRQGEQTLEQLVRKAIDHLAHHLAFVEQKRAAMQG